MTQPSQLLLKEKPAKALVAIRRNQSKEIYGSLVSRRIDTTYAHTVKILGKLEEEGLLESEKEGRKKLLSLTEEGEKYAENLQAIMGPQPWDTVLSY